MSASGTSKTGWITFVQNKLPALLSGEYAATVTHRVRNTDPSVRPGDQAYIDESFTQSKCFAVQGARFSINPNAFHSAFPPDGSQGEYADVLPHVVLSNPTLPWQRSADGRDGTPWLALLVLHADDGVGGPVTARVGDLQRKPFAPDAGSTTTRPSTLPDDAVSYPGLVLDFGESLSDRCRVIDLPVSVFNAIAPACDDLAWLAHARTIAATEPDQSGGSPSETSQDGGLRKLQPASPNAFSVVVANRLPINNDESTVHLVSLENMSGFLPAAGSYQAADIKVDGGPDAGRPAKSIRLVSLKSWKFLPMEPKETFDGFLEHVASGPLRRPAADSTDAAGRAVAEAFQMGFTALDHHTRLGDRTVSWVRGPFLPYGAGEEPEPRIPDPADAPLLASADQAMRYDPATGMMDASYAAAWQIGRLLALQNTSFATALTDWKRAVARKTILALEREYLSRRLGGSLPEVAGGRAADLLHGAMRMVAGAVAPALADLGEAVEAPVGEALRLMRRAHERHRQVVVDREALEAIHADTEPPPAVTAWLDRLLKLQGVPFGHLVPDEAMLPPESIRFFQVDRVWIEALLEGALSLGDATSGDAAHSAVLHPRLRTAVGTAKAFSGLLLRSGVVAGWPAMRITAYDNNNETLAPLRVEPLSPTILLALFEGVLARVDLMEPPLGLHFGLRDDKPLRYVTVPTGAPPNSRPGDQIEGSSAGKIPLRPDGRGVAVGALSAAVKDALNHAHANDDPATGKPRPFTTAEFALQLVEGVQEFRFVRTANSHRERRP